MKTSLGNKQLLMAEALPSGSVFILYAVSGVGYGLVL